MREIIAKNRRFQRFVRSGRFDEVEEGRRGGGGGGEDVEDGGPAEGGDELLGELDAADGGEGKGGEDEAVDRRGDLGVEGVRAAGRGHGEDTAEEEEGRAGRREEGLGAGGGRQGEEGRVQRLGDDQHEERTLEAELVNGRRAAEAPEAVEQRTEGPGGREERVPARGDLRRRRREEFVDRRVRQSSARRQRDYQVQRRERRRPQGRTHRRRLLLRRSRSLKRRQRRKLLPCLLSSSSRKDPQQDPQGAFSP
mmetsp:Transcript_11249/g.37137  ORF Transcript_11249/g.37137 Transcript_11249/m.37137 type:complete len:252 (+) Transcript_11249:559-1314(+)